MDFAEFKEKLRSNKNVIILKETNDNICYSLRNTSACFSVSPHGEGGDCVVETYEITDVDTSCFREIITYLERKDETEVVKLI